MLTLLLGLIRIKKKYRRIDKFSQAYIATYHSVFLIIAQPYSYIFIIFSVQGVGRTALRKLGNFQTAESLFPYLGKEAFLVGLYYLYSLL